MSNVFEQLQSMEESPSSQNINLFQSQRFYRFPKAKLPVEPVLIPLRLKCPEPPIAEKPRKCKKKDNLYVRSEASSERAPFLEDEEFDDYCSIEGYENEDDLELTMSDNLFACNRR